MKRLILLVSAAIAIPAAAQSDDNAASASNDTEAAATSATEASKDAAPNEAAKETAQPMTTYNLRQVDFGVQGTETDTNSSRFREYRAVPTGVYLPFLRFSGNERFRYDLVGENVLQGDARYRLRAEPGPFEIRGLYQKMPHRFGNDGHMIENEVARGRFVIPDTLQQSYQTALENQLKASPAGVNFNFLARLVAPAVAAPNTVNLALTRERGTLEMKLKNKGPVDVKLTYFQERRRGDRASGTSFGFGNVVETPEPVDYRTQDIALAAEYTGSRVGVRGGVRYNQFVNAVKIQDFDNPFRFVDSTDPNAYTGPGAGSIGGPAFGRLSLPPDNKSVTGTAGVALKFAKSTRLSVDGSLSQWTQNDPFIAYTVNTAIVSPLRAADASTLPTRSLDGKIKVSTISSSFASRPADHLNVRVNFRRYDLNNETPRISLPGYVRFDAVWEDIARISVPYGYTSDALHASTSYDFGPLTIEGGFKLDKMARTFRETGDTKQKVGYGAANVRASDWMTLRASFEKGSRDFKDLEIERSEDASFQSPGAPANLFAVDPALRQLNGQPLCAASTVCNLRLDQAAKDLDRFVGTLQIAPGDGKVTMMLSYLKGKDDYKQSVFGLTSFDNESFGAEVDYTPQERVNLFGYYNRENIKSFQRGRQSGATVSINPLDDWTAAIRDKVDSFGGGANFGVVKDKVDLRVAGGYQKLDGNNDITSPVGGAPELARRAIGGVASIPLFDDTKIYTVSAELAYRVLKSWTLGFGGWYEQYQLRDSNTNGLNNYEPGSFFLAAADSDYKAHVVYVRASYTW